jgi:hypothetical protein
MAHISNTLPVTDVSINTDQQPSETHNISNPVNDRKEGTS